MQQKINNLAEEYMTIWNAGGEKNLHVYASPEIEVIYSHFGRMYKGIEEYSSILKETHHYFPDLHIECKRIIPAATEPSVTVLWEYSGTHKNGTLFGVNASGKEIKTEGVSILKFKDGLVYKESGIVDNLSLLLQIGAIQL